MNLGGIELASIGAWCSHPAAVLIRRRSSTQLSVLLTAAKADHETEFACTLAPPRFWRGSAFLTTAASLNLGERLAQLRLESPVVALPEERFIIRSYPPSLTVAGGLVLDPGARKYRGKEAVQAVERCQTLLTGDRTSKIVAYTQVSALAGIRISELAARTGWNDEILTQSIDQAKAAGAIIDCGGVFVSTTVVGQLSRAAVTAVTEHHASEPLSRGLARETLREKLFTHSPPEVFRAVMAELERTGNWSQTKTRFARDHARQLSVG